VRLLLSHTLIFLIAIGSTSVFAIEVEVEFLGNSFFSQDVDAIAAIEAAAEHVGDAITSTLTAIDQVGFNATVGNTEATLDWDFTFRDQLTDEPIGNFPTEVPNPFLTSDTVRIFIDAQLFDGNAVSLGVPSGARAEIGATIFGPGVLNASAIQEVASLADGEMNRGDGGPLIGLLFEGPDNLGGVDVNPIRFRSSLGGVAFDIDTDNNGQIDTVQQLRDFWHVSHTAPVEPTKIDLFSVAVSEIATALGFGTSNSFQALANGLDWEGEEVIGLLGSGQDLLDPESPSQILSGTISTRISDGAIQEVSFDGDIAAGVRKELTALDLAFLRDLGFETIAAKTSRLGDFDLDKDVDGNDFLVLQRIPSIGSLADWEINYGATSPPTAASTTVPEPTTLLLLALALPMLRIRHKFGH